MKNIDRSAKTLLFMSCILFFFSTLPGLAQEDSYAAALTAARKQLQLKQYDTARIEAAKAAAMAETAEQRIKLTMFIAQISVSQQDFDRARNEYNLVIEDKTATAAQKIQAYMAKASTWLRQNNFAEAREVYNQALALPDLAPGIRADLLLNIGRSYSRERNWSATRQELMKALNLENIPANIANNLRLELARAFRGENDLAGMKPVMEQVLQEHSNAGIKTGLLRDYALLAATVKQPDIALESWQRILELPAVPDRTYKEGIFIMLAMEAERNNHTAALALAEKALAEDKLNIEDRFLAGLIGIGLNTDILPAAYPAAAAALLKRLSVPAETALSPEKKVNITHEAAKFFMRLRRYPETRGLMALADAQYLEEQPRNEYICRFMPKAPNDVSGWMTSELFNAPENRASGFVPYNQAAARLLANDVGQGEREVAVTSAPAAGTETVLAMAADVEGWHIFVQCNDPETPKIVAGLLSGGQLEMFFRPGERGAYYQWFVTLPYNTEIRAINWNSPHRHYRKMDDYARIQTAVIGDGGFGAYIFFPWEMLYDKLPQNGERWPFTLQRWSRLGSTTWGGKVHELNRFGRVEWQGLTPELEINIKRALVWRAWGRYRADRGGIISHWRDEMNGDPVFYREVLQPAITALDEMGARVKDDMSSTEIEHLFQVAVPEWFELNYLVAELRQNYLKTKLMAAAGN